jgi:hypothetical protein
MSDLWTGAGVAMILLAVCGPVAYCTAHSDGPVSLNALHLECIKAKGEWKFEGWSGHKCVFPKSASTDRGEAK